MHASLRTVAFWKTCSSRQDRENWEKAEGRGTVTITIIVASDGDKGDRGHYFGIKGKLEWAWTLLWIQTETKVTVDTNVPSSGDEGGHGHCSGIKRRQGWQLTLLWHQICIKRRQGPFLPYTEAANEKSSFFNPVYSKISYSHKRVCELESLRNSKEFIRKEEKLQQRVHAGVSPLSEPMARWIKFLYVRIFASQLVRHTYHFWYPIKVCIYSIWRPPFNYLEAYKKHFYFHT